MSIPVRDEGGSSSAEHAVDKFVCDICAQTFRFKGNLKRHQITAHVGLKPFQCEHCSKSFARKADMQVHMRVHTGEKPYPCEECGKQFARISDLRSHERTHRGEKRFACPFPMCDKQYTRRVDLKKHEMTHCASHPTASKRPLQPREATFPCPGDLASHAAHGRGCGHLSIEHGNHLDFIVNNQLVCLQGVKSLSVAPTRRILPGYARPATLTYLEMMHAHKGGVLADVDSLKLLDDDFWDFFGAMDSLTTQDEMSSGTEL
ncbi:hypothetical protein DYB37_012937 [Aphanomyces astaci]|uniref:C2H2-type domain-containing protein n=1 Tax=Aphanomyces astaci TaxID=112090 RepID=A0A418DYI5_APHAT|nr:hypothetical protein DYB35_008625 [Aphanomyces astaci]RHZ33122.1 hypothetical protein DYB37_012937 [Aphanomyces astaci]